MTFPIKAPWRALSELPESPDPMTKMKVIGWGPVTGTVMVMVSNFKGYLHGSVSSFHGNAFEDWKVDRWMPDPEPTE